MLLKQKGRVEDYKIQFQQLVYNIRLYEPATSDTFLVTRFVMGSREDLRSAVKLQLPSNVQVATMYVAVQEGLLTQQKSLKPAYQKGTTARNDTRVQLAPGELWKVKQLKEYRRANGLCYSCGEKYTLDMCAQILPL